MLCVVFLLLYKVRKGPASGAEEEPTKSSGSQPGNLPAGKIGRSRSKAAKAAGPQKKEKP